jgi:hypothetical protein
MDEEEHRRLAEREADGNQRHTLRGVRQPGDPAQLGNAAPRKSVSTRVLARGTRGTTNATMSRLASTGGDRTSDPRV